jgi:hypothetical protein
MRDPKTREDLGRFQKYIPCPQEIPKALVKRNKQVHQIKYHMVIEMFLSYFDDV